jgi:TMEM175 potassium channel family protein
MLWANLHLLFWLSIVPFVTAWMGEIHFAAMPVAAYGVVLLASSIAYFILTKALLAQEGRDSSLARAVGRDYKGGLSTALYIAALPLAFINVWLACGIYALVAAIWLVPDRRIERIIIK